MSRLARLGCVVSVALLGGMVRAADPGWFNPEQLPAQLQHPLKLLATTAMSGAGQDYFSLKPGQTATIGTITGPAIVFRVWSTSSDTKLSTLDMTVDGKKETLVAKGALPPGVAKDDPLRALDKQAYWSYVPIVVRQKAVFEARSFAAPGTAPMKFFLQVGYRQVPAAELGGVKELSASLRQWAARTSHPVFADSATAQQITGEVGQGQPWQPGFAGPALVTALTLHPLGNFGDSGQTPRQGPTPQQYQATRLVITCDGVRTIDAPLGALFGVAHKLGGNSSAGASALSYTVTLRFPVPVGQTMTIGLDKFGGKPFDRMMAAVTVLPLKQAPKYRLCAQAFSQVSVNDQPMTLLNVTGEGLFVGTNLCVDGRGRKTFAFLEGNEQIYMDGDTKPTIEGTGTEDYFNSAWYFEAGEKTNLFSGVTFMQPKDPPRVDCYRYLLTDCIPFKQSFRFDLQHGSRNKAPDVLYEGVMFWYQSSPTNVAEPVAAPSPQATGRGTEPPGGAPSGVVRLTGFVVALLVVAAAAWWFLRKRKA